jgi:putative sterol carrier protein
MKKTAKELMEFAQKKIEEKPDQVRELGAVYKFVLNGDGGGTFVVNLNDNPGITEEDGNAECTIKMSAKDFVKLVEKRSDPRLYFFMGKLRVEGDMGLAIKLKKFILQLVAALDEAGTEQ